MREFFALGLTVGALWIGSGLEEGRPHLKAGMRPPGGGIEEAWPALCSFFAGSQGRGSGYLDISRLERSRCGGGRIRVFLSRHLWLSR
jgi:hypothetical protein